jgi:hypothetical protein
MHKRVHVNTVVVVILTATTTADSTARALR